MRALRTKRRVILALLFSLIISCQGKENSWYLQGDGSHSKSLIFPAKDPNFGLELQISSLDQYFSLSVYGREIPAFKGDTKKALITIEDAGSKQNHIVHRLEGGQKLVFPNDLSAKIIAILQKGQSVKIRVASYQQNIDSKNFSQLFKKL